MSAPLWEAGHLYLPGELVQPIQAPAPVSTAITNPGFESGSTDWTLGSGMSVDATKRFSGTNSAQFTGTAGNVRVEHDKEPVAPGTSITASCMYAQGAADAGHNTGRVILRWYTSGDVLISESTGNLINSSSTGWQKSTVTATAPATAAKVAIGCLSFRDSSDASWCDQFEWNYATQTVQAGLIYQAVQADPGYSGTTEPAWPSTLGLTVVDNQVTWEAVATSRVTWTASPILQSGTVEPTWPTTPGEFVSDGTISWECISRRVEDENCPNTTVVAIMAGKVFAVDGDIVRFCATSNPLDWTSEQDAGFLPTGLNQANANDMAVLAPYRANLACLNANGFQNWQVDPDPAAMAQLDQMEGIGSTWPLAAQAVGNELFLLAALGVRTVGISVGAENLAAGDVGEPIDLMVQEAMRVTIANSGSALATYYPGAGQYWLTFPDYPPPGPSITGDLPDGLVGATGSVQYVVSGGVAPYSDITVLSGEMPPGTSMQADGSVTYSYTTPGEYSWTVGGTDADGTAFSVADTASVSEMQITGNLPDGNVGEIVTFSYTIEGGVAPIVCTILSGALPTGLSMDADGNVTGSFSAVGSYSWTVLATDAGGNTDTVSDTCQVVSLAQTLYDQVTYTGDGTASRQILTSVDLSAGGLVIIMRDGVGAIGLYSLTGATTKKINMAGTTGASETTANGFGDGYFNLVGEHQLPRAHLLNFSGGLYTAHVFKRAAGFFDVLEYTGTGALNLVTHGLGVEPGMIVLQHLTSTSPSYSTYMRSMGTSEGFQFNNDSAPQAFALTPYNATPGTADFVLKAAAFQNQAGQSCLAFLWADNSDADGVIRNVTWTGTGAPQSVTTAGWQPQSLFGRADATDSFLFMGDAYNTDFVGSDQRVYVKQIGTADTSADVVGLVSGGFQLNDTTVWNATGVVYHAIVMRK